MHSFSVWHWVIVLVPLAVVGFIVWMNVRIIRRAGYSGWWTILLFVPFLNLIMIWVFAFVEWPALRARS